MLSSKPSAVTIELGLNLFRIIAEDETIISALRTVFQTATASLYLEENTQSKKDIRTIIITKNPSEIILDGTRISTNSDQANILHTITLIFGDAIRNNASRDKATIHGSTARLSGKTLCFIGRSGSGKTTLAIKAGKKGSYIGDEYATINLVNGTISHERYPLQIKMEALHLFEKPAIADQGIMLRNEEGRQSYLVNPDMLFTKEHYACEEHDFLDYFVLPQFNPSLSKTYITEERYSHSLVQLLQAASNGEKPSCLAYRLLKIASVADIKIISLIYRNSDEAIGKLEEFLNGQETIKKDRAMIAEPLQIVGNEAVLVNSNNDISFFSL